MAFAVEDFLKTVDHLLGWINASLVSHQYVASSSALISARQIVQDDFLVDQPGECRRQKRTAEESKLVKTVRYQKSQKLKAVDEISRLKAEKDKGCIRSEVFVRVGLSDPSLNSRQLRDILITSGIPCISHVYVGRVRDAFAELLKRFARQQVEATVASASLSVTGAIRDTVFIGHIHDEASMRFRSFEKVCLEEFGPEENQQQVFSRGRYSKIQNNAITMSLGPHGSVIDWLCELQPLGKKDGLTLASATIKSVQPLFEAIVSGVEQRKAKSVRILHLISGDGLNTNENAVKKVLSDFL